MDGTGDILLLFVPIIEFIILVKLKTKKMEVSPLGVIAGVFLYETKKHHKYIEISGFAIMLNHIHAILTLNDNRHNDDGANSFQ